MNKCKNCGREFEGKFCPDCGTAYEEKLENRVCPKCGGSCDIGAAFCNSCGYAFRGNGFNFNELFQGNKSAVDQEAHVKNKTKATIFKYACSGLYVFFSLLLFAFFAAPVATSPFLGVSAGNMYQYGFAFFNLDELTKLLNTATGSAPSSFGIVAAVGFMIIVFLPIIGIVAVVGVVLYSLTGFKGIRKAEMGFIVMYLFEIALAIFEMIYVDSCGYNTGAALILVLVFSLLFFIMNIAVLAVRKRFYAKHPEFDLFC